MNHQWHVFLASLDPITGSKQAGKRPVLVISRARINQVLPVVNVIPLTSRKSAARSIYPNEVLLPTGWPVCKSIRSPSATRSARLTEAGWNRIWVNWLKRTCVRRSSKRFASSWSCEERAR